MVSKLVKPGQKMSTINKSSKIDFEVLEIVLSGVAAIKTPGVTLKAKVATNVPIANCENKRKQDQK